MRNLNQAVPKTPCCYVQQVRRVRHFHDSLKWNVLFMSPCLPHIFPVELIAHFLKRHLRIRCLEGLRHFLHGVEHQIVWRPQEFQRHDRSCCISTCIYYISPTQLVSCKFWNKSLQIKTEVKLRNIKQRAFLTTAAMEKAILNLRSSVQKPSHICPSCIVRTQQLWQHPGNPK